jgi:hypothetical protein
MPPAGVPINANPPPPQIEARQAMDAAFDAAGDGAVVPTGKPVALYVIAAIVALGVIGAIIALVLNR